MDPMEDAHDLYDCQIGVQMSRHPVYPPHSAMNPVKPFAGLESVAVTSDLPSEWMEGQAGHYEQG